MSANEKAEAILIVIKKILKWIGIGIAALIAISLLLYAWSEFDDWYSVDRHKEKVKVNAFFDPKNCGKEFPAFVAVVNNSTKTIESISFYLKVTKKGFSKQLNYSSSMEYDKILPPGEGWAQCWRIQDDNYDWAKRKTLDGNDMEIAVTSFYPKFKDKD
jgi:hypothetical protein